MTDKQAKERSATRAEERFVVDVQVFLQELMEEKGLSRSDLAAAMGVTRARISQIFSDDCTNFTVRLLARAANALGEVPEIDCAAMRLVRERQASACRSELVAGSANVIPLWNDMAAGKIEPETVCANDERLDGLLDRARLVAA
jgi:transcriptional regulator with XRE-family HTH domain